MNKIILEKPEDIHSVFKEFSSSTAYKYRGQSNFNWKLIPKCGRSSFEERNDQEIFRHWKRRAIGLLNKTFTSEIEYLTIAQHTGLPTRLLDWSHSPLIALFFCVTDNPENDGAIFVYKSLNSEIITNFNIDPFDIKNEFKIYQPTSTINRLDNQFGYFTIHKNPKKPFEEICRKNDLTKILIPKELKNALLLMLNQYGINFLTIYPDLEGLSKHLSWFYENYENWK